MRRSRLATAALITVAGAGTALVPAATAATAGTSCTGGFCTQTPYVYTTGAVSTYTVPAGVTALRITAAGADGGEGMAITDDGDALAAGPAGGKGATLEELLAVTPGEVLTINPGQAGSSVNDGVLDNDAKAAGTRSAHTVGGTDTLDPDEGISRAHGGGGAGNYDLGGGGGGATVISAGGKNLIIAGGGGGGAGAGYIDTFSESLQTDTAHSTAAWAHPSTKSAHDELTDVAGGIGAANGATGGSGTSVSGPFDAVGGLGGTAGPAGLGGATVGSLSDGVLVTDPACSDTTNNELAYASEGASGNAGTATASGVAQGGDGSDYSFLAEDSGPAQAEENFFTGGGGGGGGGNGGGGGSQGSATGTLCEDDAFTDNIAGGGGGGGGASTPVADVIPGADAQADGEGQVLIAVPQAPTITGTTAVDGSGTTATVTTTIGSLAGGVSYAVDYSTGTAGDPQTATTIIASAFTAKTVSIPVTGLTPGATYTFNVVATNIGGTADGSTVTLTVPVPAAAAVATGATLPFTGAPTTDMLAIGAGLIAGGALTRTVGRRRRQRS